MKLVKQFMLEMVELGIPLAAVRPCYYRAGEWSLDYGAAGI